MRKNRKIFLKLAALAFIVFFYPMCVLTYTWTCVFQSDLEGGKNGPLDAYRHTLASAVVSHTLGEWGVKVTTGTMGSQACGGRQMWFHKSGSDHMATENEMA